MALVGNKIAASRRSELGQLENALRALETTLFCDPTIESSLGLDDAGGVAVGMALWGEVGSTGGDSDFLSNHGWELEDGLSIQQLEAVADNLNVNGLDWLWTARSQERLDASLL